VKRDVSIADAQPGSIAEVHVVAEARLLLRIVARPDVGGSVRDASVLPVGQGIGPGEAGVARGAVARSRGTVVSAGRQSQRREEEDAKGQLSKRDLFSR
jgi:hypothetical protein